jgi:organic radical activating enzyme
MRIAGTEINLRHRALEIYLSGCRGPHCPGCHNAELWDFAVGDIFNQAACQKLLDKLVTLRNARMVDYVWVLGGEPLDQDQDSLARLLAQLHDRAKIVLWTHYERVPDMLAELCDYAKLGPYVANGEAYDEPVFGVKLANREQRIVKL